MITMRLDEVAKIVAGQTTYGNIVFAGISTDSRSDCTGKLFVPLKGERFDGHQYIPMAKQNGAVASLTSEESNCELPTVKVFNTHQALLELTKLWRQQKILKCIAVTGSNGKTTVKEMIATILGQNASVLKNEGNFNNNIGVPLTLAALDETHQYMVAELGANHAGEIAQLAELVAPDISVITTIAPAHLEGFGSLQGVADAKGEIIDALAEDGICIIPANERFSEQLKQRALGKVTSAERKIITFAKEDADISVVCFPKGADPTLTISTPKGNLSCSFNLLGEHNAVNACAVVAVSIALDIPFAQIRRGLSEVKAVKHRLQLTRGINNCLVLDDTYNANPASLNVALDVLVDFDLPTWLVLGDMAELGKDSELLHYEAGIKAREKGVNRVWTYGKLAAKTALGFEDDRYCYESKETMTDDLVKVLTLETYDPVVILVKGSRSTTMETVVDMLSRINTKNQVH